jgi:hypothetical protein
MIEVKPLLQVLIAERLWSIPDERDRKAAIMKYLDTGYSGWRPVEIKRPFVLCSDDRKAKR